MFAVGVTFKYMPYLQVQVTSQDNLSLDPYDPVPVRDVEIQYSDQSSDPGDSSADEYDLVVCDSDLL